MLECGSNIGGNIRFLNELSAAAYNVVSRSFRSEHAFNGSILESNLPRGAFDLVFTRGVLTHIHPESLLANLARMFEHSRHYVLIAEYFNRTPVMIEYHGERDRLFKRDFGNFAIEHLPLQVIDYGLLWGHVYDSAGFDDITWWLLRKN